MSKPTLEERLARAKESASKIRKLADKGNAETVARIEDHNHFHEQLKHDDHKVEKIGHTKGSCEIM
ncbi:hypothetical protein JS61_07885 (plasmid) [Rickettsia felis]|uniref:hypothetical protein n=1 Tax=Rickettsia felis TaxID=42862 RepID=UPI0005757C9D|nr:hypothetical protein [Rickettsia felis]KHO02245.1 hypothetical protein JS61_07885 [Rickettsia felis]